MTSMKSKYWFAWFATLTVLISALWACEDPFAVDDAWSCRAEQTIRWYEGEIGFSDYTTVTYSATRFGSNRNKAKKNAIDGWYEECNEKKPSGRKDCTLISDPAELGISCWENE